MSNIKDGFSIEGKIEFRLTDSKVPQYRVILEQADRTPIFSSCEQ